MRDTTGAGDTFAGGLAGFLASRNSIDVEDLKRAVVVGTVMASFTVEGFSLQRIGAVTPADLRERFRSMEELTQFGSWEKR